MSTPAKRCLCGNPAIAGRPTCGIVICLANDAYETAEWLRRQSPARQQNQQQKG